jgi:hypothetical protein
LIPRGKLHFGGCSFWQVKGGGDHEMI